MSDEKQRFEKVLAIAVDPGAYEAEAIAALRKARELAKRNPLLAINGGGSPELPVPIGPEPEYSVQFRVTKIPPPWLNICMNSLSAEAYGLGLRSRLYCDFTEIPIALDVRCDGSHQACEAFLVHLNALIDYLGSQSGEDLEGQSRES
jgi:hypothetical protein